MPKNFTDMLTGEDKQTLIDIFGAEVVDNLTSINVDKPLSANQGKALKGLIDTLDTSNSSKLPKDGSQPMTGNLEAPSMSIGGDFLSAFSFKNKLINGDFGIWNRGTAAVTGNNKYSADGWVTASVNSTHIVTQYVTAGNKTGFGIATYASANTGYVEQSQRIENVRALPSNKKYTLSVKYSSSIPLDIVVASNYGSGGSATNARIETTFPTSGQETTASVTFSFYYDGTQTIGEGHHNYISIRNTAQVGQFNIIDVQLEEGEVATPSEQRPIGFEKMLCKRRLPYREGGSAYVRHGVGEAISTTQATIVLPTKTTSRIKPTSIIYSGAFSLVGNGSIIPVTSMAINGDSTEDTLIVSVTVASGLVANHTYVLRNNNDASAYIEVSTDL